VTTEFNIEGNPIPKFMEYVLSVRPHQVTLVPDAPDALTSDNGWNPRENMQFLRDRISTFHEAGIRTSIFIDPDPDRIRAAADTGTDRIELYTGPYAEAVQKNSYSSILKKYAEAAQLANELGMEVNAGHDLNLKNLKVFYQALHPYLAEVSIGQALVVDALYYGIENAIKMYLIQLSEH
jgi:pyridoxine 5-phosphate synthase